MLLLLSSHLLTAQVKIMPLGDSITQGEADEGTYRQALWDLFQAAGIPVDFVGSFTSFFGCGVYAGSPFDQDHEGHWGWRTDQILDGTGSAFQCRVATAGTSLSDWLAAYTPDIALVHLGTNDMLQGQSVGSTVGELEDVIDVLRADNANVVVFLAQLIPTKFGSNNTNINALNAALPALAASKTTPNSPVIIVDQNTGYVADTDNYDPYHPNNLGQAKIAQRWFEAVDSYLNPTTFPVAWGALDAAVVGDRIALRWETLTEANNLGFEVELMGGRDADFRAIGFVQGEGDSPVPVPYRFETEALFPGPYLLRLRQLDFDGQFSLSPVLDVTIAPQPEAELQVYTFAVEQEVGFAYRGLAPGAEVTLSIRDLFGREVSRSVHRWEGMPLRVSTRQLSAGVYTAFLTHAGDQRVHARFSTSR